jgi:hypothetical protein
MKELNFFKYKKFVALTALLLAIAGCGGSTTSGGEEDFQDSQFVPDGSSSGGIELEPEEMELNVGETTGFKVRVFNDSEEDGTPGAGVANISVACDSEGELAIIEPQSGRFLTNSDGYASGKFGCSGAGSFVLGCRLPITGANRVFKSIRCVGPTPPDFQGFPGAAGGGLGGGVVNPTPSVDNFSGLRVVQVTIQSITGEADSTAEIDTSVGICDQGTADPADDTQEPFGNDNITFSVQNNSLQLVQFTGYRYTVVRGRTDGSDYVSPVIGLTGSSAPDASVDISAIIFRPNSGNKSFAGGTAISPTLGLRTIQLTLFGQTANGEGVELSASIAADFDNYNACEAS